MVNVTEEIKGIFGDIVVNAELTGDEARIEYDYKHHYEFPFQGTLEIEFINGKKVEFEHSESGWLNRIKR